MSIFNKRARSTNKINHKSKTSFDKNKINFDS